ncbi:hypothetical protein AHAS_Ahas16G0141100 [Arachis hypogaea]
MNIERPQSHPTPFCLSLTHTHQKTLVPPIILSFLQIPRIATTHHPISELKLIADPSLLVALSVRARFVAVGRAASLLLAVGRAASLLLTVGRPASLLLAVGRPASLLLAVGRLRSPLLVVPPSPFLVVVIYASMLQTVSHRRASLLRVESRLPFIVSHVLVSASTLLGLRSQFSVLKFLLL